MLKEIYAIMRYKRIEIHTHTSEQSPCSSIPAVDLVSLVHTKGASGIVITDHHFLWSKWELDGLRELCEVPDDFLIFSGQEVTTSDFGDILVYGADESIEPGVSLSSVRRKFPEAAIVWAHPYRSGLVPSEIELFNSDLDAIEIVNPHQKEHENMCGVSDWNLWDFNATSGSDIHRHTIAEFYPTVFTVGVDTLHSLVNSIKNGFCLPTYKYISSGEAS
jgi:predicted metal-dependent phosphoesterase TrpH